MKTAILTIALALASSLSALAQTVMRENSTVYFKTNVFLHDNPTSPLHQRISVEWQEPLWVAASNQVVYYQSSEMTNAWLHTRYLHATNFVFGGVARTNWPQYATDTNALDIAGTRAMTGNLNMGGKAIMNAVISGVVPTTNYTYSIYDLSLADTGSRTTLGGIMMKNPFGDGALFSQSSSVFYYFNGGEGNENMGILWQVENVSGPGPATNVWRGRVNDTESSRIAALPVSPMTFNSTSWLQSDGTNLFFVSTVPPGFTNALTTNAP